MEGRRYKEEPAPINDSLERHYQETIKTLEGKLNYANDTAREMAAEIERLKFKIKLKDIEIESLVKSMAGGEM
jgi:CII-binding regulator of phage lambda lysogenization HflD